MTRGHGTSQSALSATLPTPVTAAAIVAAAIVAALGWAAATSSVARAEPDREDVEAAEEALRELEVRHQRAVEDFLVAESELEELDGAVDRTEDRVEELRAESAAHEDGAAEVLRRLYSGRSAASAASMLEASDAAEAGRRAIYLEFAERGHRAALEDYRHARVELDHEATELQAARAEAAELREELHARAERIDAESAEQQERLASLREQVAEREARQQAARERAAAEQAASEAAAAQDASANTSANTSEVASRGDAAPASRSASDEAAEPAAEPASGETPTTSSEQANAAVEAAMSRRGKPYEWGATGPDRFDCSGLTQWSYKQAGVDIPRSSRAQYAGLPKVSRSELRPGDLVFFGDPIHHMGMYIGDGQMVEAPYSGQSVRVRAMDRSDYAGAARPGG